MALLPEGHKSVITDISVAHQLPKARERQGLGAAIFTPQAGRQNLAVGADSRQTSGVAVGPSKGQPADQHLIVTLWVRSAANQNVMDGHSAQPNLSHRRMNSLGENSMISQFATA
jgi:hypothetical protein